MRRWAALALFGLAGCTNAPVAGFLDLVHPVHVQQREPRNLDRPAAEPFAPVNPSSRPPAEPFAPVSPPPASPPSGGQLLPPAATPGRPISAGENSGFTPRDNEPLPPPSTPRSGTPAGPLTLPNM
jgi:hypothetical protein